MTDSTAVLEGSYSEVVVNVIDLALNWQLFSNVGRPALMEKQDLDTDTDMDTDTDICACTMVGLNYRTYPHYLF